MTSERMNPNGPSRKPISSQPNALRPLLDATTAVTTPNRSQMMNHSMRRTPMSSALALRLDNVVVIVGDPYPPLDAVGIAGDAREELEGGRRPRRHRFQVLTGRPCRRLGENRLAGTIKDLEL